MISMPVIKRGNSQSCITKADCYVDLHASCSIDTFLNNKVRPEFSSLYLISDNVWLVSNSMRSTNKEKKSPTECSIVELFVSMYWEQKDSQIFSIWYIYIPFRTSTKHYPSCKFTGLFPFCLRLHPGCLCVKGMTSIMEHFKDRLHKHTIHT